MPIAQVTKEQVQAALKQFDKELTSSLELASWKDNKAYKYTIHVGEQL
jgi:hypothetical protein